jgi:hypothetical protein
MINETMGAAVPRADGDTDTDTDMDIDTVIDINDVVVVI